MFDLLCLNWSKTLKSRESGEPDLIRIAGVHQEVFRMGYFVYNALHVIIWKWLSEIKLFAASFLSEDIEGDQCLI